MKKVRPPLRIHINYNKINSYVYPIGDYIENKEPIPLINDEDDLIIVI